MRRGGGGGVSGKVKGKGKGKERGGTEWRRGLGFAWGRGNVLCFWSARGFWWGGGRRGAGGFD